MDDPDAVEGRKLLELLESVELLLQIEVFQQLAGNNFTQLSQLHDLLRSWTQGESSLTHDQMIAAISDLTDALNKNKWVYLDAEQDTLQ